MLERGAAMTKKIILLSDGTGNAAAKVWRSNVWRLFESLDLTKPDQVAIYDDGVGTAAFKPLALLGGAFGWGLKRNVIDLYAFLCRNYERDTETSETDVEAPEPGAESSTKNPATPGQKVEIFGFGFSRGAFTMRIVAGLVANQGVILAKEAAGEVDLQRLARAAYRRYRRERFHSILHVEWPFRRIRDWLVDLENWLRDRKPYKPEKNAQPKIRFLGLWDTVAAYGLPIDEMTRGFSQWIWPLEFPDRMLSRKVVRACHALALDDERTTFHPMLWTEAGEDPTPTTNGYRHVKDERLSQVWFAGMHANVGGGYPDDRLAHVPLVWIMRQAALCGLEFKQAPLDDPDAIRHARSAADKDGRLYDSRKGLAGYYRYGPRKIAELCAPHYAPVVALLARLLRRDPGSIGRRFPKKHVVEIAEPKIHVTAIERMQIGAFAYAPIGFPSRYAVVDLDGRILAGGDHPFEPPAEAQDRAAAQERVWNFVWARRLVYFLTLFASFHLALVPVLYKTPREDEFSSTIPLVSKLVRLVGGFLPGLAQWWIDAFAARPWIFVISLAVVVVLMWIGIYFGARVSDEMRVIWKVVKTRREGGDADELPAPPTDSLFRLRTSDGYRSVFWLLKWVVLPAGFTVVILYLGVAALNRLAVTIGDGWGRYCEETRGHAAAELPPGATRELEGFETRDVCWPTGILMKARGRYELTLHENGPWLDGDQRGALIESRVEGFEMGELELAPRVRMILAVPLRRSLWQPWFRPIARIGAAGSDEYPFDPEDRATVQGEERNEIRMTIRARRDGELFLYVNDALWGASSLKERFYRYNQGSASVTVKRLR
jgi:uncharacterized protein (DUF2235 family)